MLSSNYIASTHNITHSPCTSTYTTHPAIPSPLPSITLLCTQLTNTKHSWQNGTRCRDGVNVLWCRSHLVWLAFEGSIPTCACFHSENFFVTCIYMVRAYSVYTCCRICARCNISPTLHVGSCNHSCSRDKISRTERLNGWNQHNRELKTVRRGRHD